MPRPKDIEQHKKLIFYLQHEEEKVLKILRRSLVIELPWVFLSIIMVTVLLLIGSNETVIMDNPELSGFIKYIVYSLVLFIAIYDFNRFLNWFYSVNIISSERLLDFEFKELGIKNIVECQLKNIQSVTLKNEGFLSFIFGLSTVQVLTSGDNPNIDFEFIAGGNQIQDLISDLAREINKK